MPRGTALASGGRIVDTACGAGVGLARLGLHYPGCDLIVNNISMHECRDIDEVTRRVHDGLEPGGWFVISDFPFPDTDEGLATVPGRIMSGIQFCNGKQQPIVLPHEDVTPGDLR